ncbi:unnamed protein product [Adineta ricciae]|uniref:Gamma-secretase subunit PEN-2 n=1 Tax=Adineta ricciae TaxID=249248 RepID=A0A815Y9Y9_ADIRI|nr:unnamed protein product [Adineta ricciae]CAF1567165.1 unnamed protein product [Adineta ricciae]
MSIPKTRWRCEQFHQSRTNANNGCQIINAQIHSDYEESTVESNKDNMVSLEKKSPEERLNICRKYYLGGFAFLPLLWLINAIWFYKQAFKVEPYPQQAQIRTYVIRSAIGTLAWLLIITIWNVLFQVFRTKMGPAGDYLTFVVPRGYY